VSGEVPRGGARHSADPKTAVDDEIDAAADSRRLQLLNGRVDRGGLATDAGSGETGARRDLDSHSIHLQRRVALQRAGQGSGAAARLSCLQHGGARDRRQGSAGGAPDRVKRLDFDQRCRFDTRSRDPVHGPGSRAIRDQSGVRLRECPRGSRRRHTTSTLCCDTTKR
jgi:hypothetical protein